MRFTRDHQVFISPYYTHVQPIPEYCIAQSGLYIILIQMISLNENV